MNISKEINRQDLGFKNDIQKPMMETEGSSVKAIDPDQEKEEPEIFTVSSYRWVILMSLVASLISSNFIMMTFSTVSGLIAEIYDIKIALVNSCVTIFLIAAIIMQIPSVYFIEKFGLSNTFKVAVLVTVVGSWMRYFCIFSLNSFTLILIPQGLVALANPVITNGISKTAYRWFGDNQKAVAISFGALGTPIGCMCGMLIGPLFISELKQGGSLTAAQREQGQLEVQNYILWHAIIDTILCVPLILFFVEKPTVYPSQAAKTMDQVREQTEYSVSQDFVIMKSKPGFLFFLANFAIVHGIYAAIGATISNVVRPFGYTSVQSSMFGGVCIIGGLVASYVYSAILDYAQDKDQMMIRLLNIISIGSLFSFFIMIFMLRPNNLPGVMLTIGLAGTFLIPMMPIGYYAAVELSRPVTEPMSSGLIMVAGMIFGVAFTYYVSYMCDANDSISIQQQQHNVRICVIVMCVWLAVACGIMYFVRPQTEEVDENEKERDEDDNHLLINS